MGAWVLINAGWCYIHFVRWRKVGVWARTIAAMTEVYDRGIQIIDTTMVRVH